MVFWERPWLLIPIESCHSDSSDPWKTSSRGKERGHPRKASARKDRYKWSKHCRWTLIKARNRTTTGDGIERNEDSQKAEAPVKGRGETTKKKVHSGGKAHTGTNPQGEEYLQRIVKRLKVDKNPRIKGRPGRAHWRDSKGNPHS